MREINEFMNGFDKFSRFAPDSRDSKSQAFGDAIKFFLLSVAADGAEKAMKNRKWRKRYLLGNSMGHNFASLSRKNLENAGPSVSRTHQMEEIDCSIDDETKRVPEKMLNLAIVKPEKPEYDEFKNPHSYKTHSEISQTFPPNLPAFLVVLALKLITLQFNLAVIFFMSPIWVSYLFFSLALFPFYTLSRIKAHLVKKLQEMIESFKLKVQRTMVRIGRALFWAFCTSLMLVGMLVLGFVFGGVLVKCMIEEPVMMKESLHFDYTMGNPAAVVSLSSPGVARSLPYNRKFRLAVSLTVPESEFNTKIGIFQVRIELLSARGKVSTNSSYPCMLRFKSKPIRFLETAIRTAPLLAGFQSETQTLYVKTNDFKEGLEPTALAKITLEQRARTTAATGIPEVYAAALAIESMPSRLMKMMWFWRRTVFVWVSFAVFCLELVFALLIVCGGIVFPTRRNRKIYCFWGKGFEDLLLRKIKD